MKKKLFLLNVVMLAVASFFSIAQANDRAHQLKIYNWSDYIDMQNVLDKFPAWYKEQTGEDVEIIYETFDINESMLTQIEVGQEDYDVICPSEYIIERMLRQNLLLPIDKNYGSTEDYTKKVAPFVLEKFQQMAPQGSDVQVSDYAVGYMWGTTGVLYNPTYVSEGELRSWDFLLNPKFKNRIFMKDAFRDVYSVVVLYAYRDEIARGEVSRADLVQFTTLERIQRVEDILLQAKENIAGWEVDFGKEEMTKGNTWLNLSWSGDAQWAIDEAKDVNVELKYIVPEEGSNVWFDGWCIPKYAQNTKAASYFINFLCMPENAILNMEEIGYVSVIADSTILEWANDDEIEETADLTYFFGPEANAVHANQLFYPDQSVIDRCSLMHDCGDNAEALINMWNRVKGDNLSMTPIIILSVAGILALVYLIYVLVRKKKTAKSRAKSKKK